jgi:hypothetical protein
MSSSTSRVITTSTCAPAASTVAKRVGGPGSDGQVFTLLKYTARIADEHFEATTEDAERLI